MEAVFALVVVGVMLLVQLVAWILGGFIFLYGLRFIYRFVTAPRDGPPSAVAVYEPPLQETAAPPSQAATTVEPPEPALATAVTAPPPAAQTRAPATSDEPRRTLDLSRYLDYARWGAAAGVITTLVGALQSVLTATGLQGSGVDTEFNGLAMIAAVLVCAVPLLWLSWSMLRTPRAWKVWLILIWISLSLLDGAWSIFVRHDEVAMLEVFPNTVAFWYAVQAVRGRRAAVAAARGQESEPVSDPGGIWTSNFARATWGAILLLAFVGDLMNHHAPVQAASRTDTEQASTPAPSTAVQNATVASTPALAPPPPSASSSDSPTGDDTWDVIPAQDGSRPPAALVRSWGENEENCRGSSTPDSPDTLAACTVRDNAYDQLNKLGWCHGREDEASAGWRWQQCEPGTNGYKDSPQAKAAG